MNSRVIEVFNFVDDPAQLKLRDLKFRFDNSVMFSKKQEDFMLYKQTSDNYFNVSQHIVINIK